MKDYEMRRVFCLTWAGWLNVLLQFSGFRLVRHVGTDARDFGEITKWEFRFVGAPWKYGWSIPRIPSGKREE